MGESDASEGFVSRRGSLACSKKCDGDAPWSLVFLKRGLVGLVSIGFFWACTPLLG
jgi:hypothetical protein